MAQRRVPALLGWLGLLAPVAMGCSLSDPTFYEYTAGIGRGGFGASARGGSPDTGGSSQGASGGRDGDGTSGQGGDSGGAGLAQGGSGDLAGMGGGAGTGASTGGSTDTGGSAGTGGASGTGGSAGSGGSGGGINPCDRASWYVTASESSLNQGDLFNPPAQAVDGDLTTRWSTGSDLVGGEWFLIDLGAIAPHVSELLLDATCSPNDYPIGYKLELSETGSVFFSVANGEGAPVMTINFTDSPARFLRITQLGSRSGWWSICELRVICQAN